jgi:hypothetical protein
MWPAVAITNHAVDRYLERVSGAKGFERESVREMIRKLVEDGFNLHQVRPHPTERNRRIIPFKSGKSILYLSIGPNTTTFKDADIAVISVLFEHEVTDGKAGLDVSLGDKIAPLPNGILMRHPPKYAVFVGEEPMVEVYRFKTLEEIDQLIKSKTSIDSDEGSPDIDIYELVPVKP